MSFVICLLPWLAAAFTILRHCAAMMFLKYDPETNTDRVGPISDSDLKPGVANIMLWLRKVYRAVCCHGERLSDLDGSVLRLTTTDTTTNLSGASATAIPWDVVVIGNQEFYRHKPSGTTTEKARIYFRCSGLYEIATTINHTRSAATNVRIHVKARLNGADVQGEAYGGLMYAGDAGDRSSAHLVTTVRARNGDYLEITSEARLAQSSTVNLTRSSILTIRKVG